MTKEEQDPIATLYIRENVFPWRIFSIATTRSVHISNQQFTLIITAEKTRQQLLKTYHISRLWRRWWFDSIHSFVILCCACFARGFSPRMNQSISLQGHSNPSLQSIQSPVKNCQISISPIPAQSVQSVQSVQSTRSAVKKTFFPIKS